MIITETICRLILLRAMTKPGTIYRPISKDEGDAADHIERMLFCLAHLPEEKFPLKPEFRIYKGNKGKVISLEFLFGDDEPASSIEATPAGSDQIRQRAATLAFGDEWAFIKEAREAWAAIKPTTMGGGEGEIWLCSTAAGGTFAAEMIQDRDIAYGDAFGDGSVPLRGFHTGVTHGGIFWIGLDYEADEEKRDNPEWEQEAFLGLSEEQIRREYRRDWTLHAGRPVFDEWVDRLHIAPNPISFDSSETLFAMWDNTGNDPAVTWMQVQDGTYCILAEKQGKGGGFDQFCQEALEQEAGDFPDADTYDITDPSGWSPNPSDGKSNRDILYRKRCEQKGRKGLQSLSVRIAAGPSLLSERIDPVKGLLNQLSKGKARLQVSPACACLNPFNRRIESMVIQGFRGGYVWNRLGDKPEKGQGSIYHNIMDSIEHGVGYLMKYGGYKSNRAPATVSRDGAIEREWDREDDQPPKQRMAENYYL